MSMSAGLVELHLAAWAERFRRPEALLDRAKALADAAAPGSVDAAWADLHATLGLRAAGRRDEATATLARAAEGFARHDAATGLRLCHALRALPLVAAGQGEQALRELGEIDPRDFDAGPSGLPPVLMAYAAQFAHWARAMALGAAGRWDDALRDRYASVQHARATGDDAAIAHALADLAAVQADLCNAEGSLALATEAQSHGERAGRSLGWTMAVYNRLAALLALQRHDEAAVLARELMPQLDELNPRNRESACLLLGRALLHGGDAATARALLERSRRESIVGHRAEAALLEAELRLAEGDDAGALARIDEVLAGDGPRASGPDTLMLLHRLASGAGERLGDAAVALRHARAERDRLAEVLSRGAQARRLALEIAHRLDQERLQREQAQQRQRDAEAERERLDVLNRALAEASQAKTRFLAAASHDLRQPVQALSMNMAALQAERLDATQERLVGRMAQSLDALGRMFDVLLDISRLDAGIVPVHIEPVPLRPLLQRLRDEHLGAAEAAGLVLRLRGPTRGDVPGREPAPLVLSDASLLERCLRNLLDNALKYTRRGGVLLAVRLAAGGPAGSGRWRIDVVDTGIGMTPEEQSRVFEEFYQAANPGRDHARGLGLGGSIVQRVCQLLGHPLQLRSQPGRGTRVSLWLPAAIEPVPAAAGVPAQAPTAGATASLCLLVVDDDAAVRDSLVAVLERWGHVALAGADPADVLRRWHRAGCPRVQALLCDLRLRGPLDGVMAVGELRQTFGGALPALVITGDTAPDRLQHLRASGLPWLSKPVLPMRLRSWLAGVAAASC